MDAGRQEALETVASWNGLLSLVLVFDSVGLVYILHPPDGLPPFRLAFLLLMSVAPFFNLHVLEYARAARQEQDGQAAQAGRDARAWWKVVAQVWGALWCLPKLLYRGGTHPAFAACASVASILAYVLLGVSAREGTPRSAMGGFMLWAPALIGLPTLIVDALELCLMWRVPAIAEVHTRVVLLAGWIGLAVLQTYIITWVAITGDDAKRTAEKQELLHAELKARDRLIQSQRQAEAAQRKFTRYIFHEVRTPFNSLDMGLALLEEEEKGNLSKAGRATLAMLTTAALSMRVIINDTLDWSKIESGTFSLVLGPTNLSSIVQSTMLSMRPLASSSDYRVHLHSEVDSRLPPCTCADGVRLQQVIGNLISNAIKFSPKNGTGQVTLRARLLQLNTRSASPSSLASTNGRPFTMRGVWWKQEAGDTLHDAQRSTETPWGSVDYDSMASSASDSAVQQLLSSLALPTPPPSCAAAVDGECLVLLEVQDNGGGIAKSDLPTLFQAFKQLDAGLQYRSKGTGLGLAICHEIVAKHGGRMGVRSSGKQGEGASFLVALRVPVLDQAGPSISPEGSRLFAHASRAQAREQAAAAATSAVPSTSHVRVHVREETVEHRQEQERDIWAHTGDPRSMRVGSEHLASQDAAVPGEDHPVPLAPAQVSLPGATQSDDPASSIWYADKARGAPAASAGVLRVLVVDDAPDNRKLLSRTLQIKLGKAIAAGAFGSRFGRVQIDMADDGDTAVEKAVGILACVAQEYAHVPERQAGHGSIILGEPSPSVRALAAECKYDVITMDAEMPRLSGYAAVPLIRETGFTGPIYGCTGNALALDQQLFLKAGASQMFVKPIDVGAVVKAIVKDLGGDVTLL